MDELTYEEKLKLENSREHLKVVLGNVRIANSELSQVYEELSRVRELLAKAKKDRDSIIEVSSTLSIEIDEKKKQLERKEESLLLRENKLKQADNEMEAKISEQRLELEKIIKEKNRIVSDTNHTISMYTSIISNLEDKLSQLEKDIEESQEKRNYITNAIFDNENKLSKIQDEIEESKKSLDSFRIASNKEIVKTRVLIEEEKDKIRKPLELLGLETDKLNRKLKDFAIIKARLTQQFRLLNPDRLLPIELQDEQNK